MKSILLIFYLCIFFIQDSWGQETIKISFDQKNYEDYHFSNKKSHGYVLTFLLEGNSIYYRADDSNHTIKLPKGFTSNAAAYGFLFFTGKNKGALSRNILFLIDNYKSNNPKFYIDYNNNLNLSDDGLPQLLGKEMDIKIPNYQHKNTYSFVKLMKFKEENNNEVLKLFSEAYKDKAKLLKYKYWYTDKRMRNKFINTYVDGKEIKIGIHDYDGDGLYDKKGKDRIMVVDDKNQHITPKLIDGAIVYEDKVLLSIDNKTYTVLSIEPTGKNITIQKSDSVISKKGVRVGNQIPSLEFELLKKDSQKIKVNLADLIKNKYTLFDFWGSWCKPCVTGIPKIKSLKAKYKQLQIIGLNYGDDPKTINNFTTNKSIEWVNGILTKELKSKLSIDGFPNYFLVNPTGKILSISPNLNDIESEIKKHMNE